jgi:hypothetical protein
MSDVIRLGVSGIHRPDVRGPHIMMIGGTIALIAPTTWWVRRISIGIVGASARKTWRRAIVRPWLPPLLSGVLMSKQTPVVERARLVFVRAVV